MDLAALRCLRAVHTLPMMTRIGCPRRTQSSVVVPLRSNPPSRTACLPLSDLRFSLKAATPRAAHRSP